MNMLLWYVFLVFCLAQTVINAPITEVSNINQETDIESIDTYYYNKRTNADYLTRSEPESDGNLYSEMSIQEKVSKNIYEEGRIDRLELGWWKKMKHSIEKTVKKLRDEVIKDLANAIVG
ncbi:hypothetical protein L3Y34_014513 [Caenorhabditis briggsae]|uniref:Uncharacterized protein n=1 Tax=Caenorhabditis briggsae TaxID=6238 RepID=A0AAE9IXL6_CAEBR|nr:hypothetical protein L3Y34_014513 [Caenorhabditis briggsae]